MARKPKTASRALAFLLAAIMTVGSFQTTTYAADYGNGGSLVSASALIDDPVSGVTGSGWDNIGLGGSNTPTETPSEDDGKPETPPSEDGETPDPDSEIPDGEQPGDGDSETSPDEDESEGNKDDENMDNPDPQPGDGKQPDDETTPEGEEPDPDGNGAVDAGNLEGVDDSVPGETPVDGVINGTELSWAVNLAAAAEAQNSMITPFAAGDEGGGTVEFTPYSWGESDGDGQNSIWMGSMPGGGGWYFADVHRITYDGSTAFCAEFNGQQPGGEYVRGAEGNDEYIKQVIASVEASSQSRSDYIAAQALIWAHLKGTTVTYWGSSGANENLLIPGIDTSGIRYWTYTSLDHTQNIFVYTTDDNPFEGRYAIKIIKKNEDGSAVLSGATFSVTGPGGFNQTGLTTDSSGEILVGVMEAGEYTVTETSPPAGYELADPSSQKVTVTEDNDRNNPAEVEFRNTKSDNPGGGGDEGEETTETETETEVHQSKTYEYSDAIGQITIRKEDQDGNSLDGAEFKVTLEFSNGDTEVHEGVEIDNGAKVFTWTNPQDDHGPVKVTVEETKAPRYYELDPTPQTVTVHPTYTRVTHVETWTVTVTTTTVTVVHEDGTIEENTSTATTTSDPQVEEFADFVEGDREVTVTFVNDRVTGDIIVIKRDANTGAALAGASIHLWSTDLGGVDEGATDVDLVKITDENGEARFENLPAGSYAVQETRAPAGYNLNDEVQPVTLQSGEVVTIEVNDYKKDGLFIKKVDENGQPLAGAVFELRRGSGEVLLSETTDENGLIYRGNLTDDTYVIEEIQAPEGYLLDENPIKQIRIYETDDNKEYTVTFVNKKKPAIEVIKVDGLDPTLKLEGASFRITNSRTGQYWDITTGEDGTALLENLEIDTTYIVEEIDPPEGYINSGYRQEIVLKECRTHTITVENFEHPGIQIVKKDKQTGDPLPGATFRISWEDGQQYRDVTTGEDGTALVTGLNAGWYTIVETKAPEGYLLDTTPHNVMLEEGKTAVVELFNEAKPSLTIYKLDSVTQTPLANAPFRIEKKTDNGTELIGEYTSDADGIVRLEQIDPGRYLITEIKAPDGYNIDAPTQEVTIEYGEAYEVTFTDTPKSPIYIAKVDQDGNPLAGAKLRP